MYKTGIKYKSAERLTPDWMQSWFDISISGEDFEYIVTSSENFSTFPEEAFAAIITPEEFAEWKAGNLKLVNGELVPQSCVYIIVPKILTSTLIAAGMLAKVEEVLSHENDFNHTLRYDDAVDRNGNDIKIKRTLEFIVCRVIWIETSAAELQAIINMFNAREDDRAIDFDCKFNTLQELEDFKNA